MLFLVVGVLSTVAAVFLLWHFRARDGKSHPLMESWFGSVMPILLVILLMFGVSMAIAGIVR
jgi:hypothetical protein